LQYAGIPTLRCVQAIGTRPTATPTALPADCGGDNMVEHWLACYAMLLLTSVPAFGIGVPADRGIAGHQTNHWASDQRVWVCIVSGWVQHHSARPGDLPVSPCESSGRRSSMSASGRSALGITVLRSWSDP
jgi:hypothetical protein